MSVNEVASYVVGVLSRAESLFAAPADIMPSQPAEIIEAAEAGRAVRARTGQLSGALASSHRDTVAAAAQRLEGAADIDSRLVDHVAEGAGMHGAGASRATELRAGAAQVPTRLGPWAELPAGELAALRALRARVARMHELLGEHSAGAARVAGQIRALEYPM